MINLRRRRLLHDTAEPVMSPVIGNNSTRDSYINEANFDTNMVIILAALLCALIFALGLNSIVRCAFRCRRSLSSEMPEQGGAGLKKRALRQIPVAVYGSGVNIPSTECPICLGEFLEGEKVRILPNCNHGFHVKCIDTWLVSNSSCPNCRHSLLDRPSPTTTDEAHSPGNDSVRRGSVVVVVGESS